MNGLIRWLHPIPSRSLGAEMDRVFGTLFGVGEWPGADLSFQARGFSPAVDVRETEEGFTLAVEVPGLGVGDVTVNLEDGRLVVSGEKGEEEEEGTNGRRERCYGAFRRVFTVPDTVDEKGVDATMKDGVLKVILPKREEAKPRSRPIKVKAG